MRELTAHMVAAFACTKYGSNKIKGIIEKMDFNEDVFRACHIIAKMKLSGEPFDSEGMIFGMLFLAKELSEKTKSRLMMNIVASYLLVDAETAILEEIENA